MYNCGYIMFLNCAYLICGHILIHFWKQSQHFKIKVPKNIFENQVNKLKLSSQKSFNIHRKKLIMSGTFNIQLVYVYKTMLRAR